MAEDTRSEEHKKVEEEHRKGREAQAKRNEEAMRRQEDAIPTPTQEENDLARAGFPDGEHKGTKSGREGKDQPQPDEQIPEPTGYPPGTPEDAQVRRQRRGSERR
jgi:hypothetical protein